MRDPYLYDEVDVLKNLADIRDKELLRKAEADITSQAILAVYIQKYDIFNSEALQDIHRIIFGQIYDWAGDFRTIQIVKPEDILGGDSVRYAHPKDIKRQTAALMKEIAKLSRNGKNDRDVVFRLVRIIAQIWQVHPFREGNTRSVIVFAVLFAKSLDFSVDHEIFNKNSAYVRNALVWASQGIYSRFEYLERIFFDAILHEYIGPEEQSPSNTEKYSKIGDYDLKDYKERQHEQSDDENS